MSVRLVSTDRGLGRLEGDTVQLLRGDHQDLGAALAAGADLAALAESPVAEEVPLAELNLRPPVASPGQIWAVGLNYKAHASEINGMDLREPFIFPKAPGSVIGPGEEIAIPRLAAEEVDFEGEMALVISRRAESVPAAEADRYIAGITILNDVSARTVQKGDDGVRANISMAKSFRTFAPLGPAVALYESVAAPEDLQLKTTVSGEVRQEASTAQMIFGVGELVEYLTARVTLMPGDIVATGTPAGVGDVDGRFLAPGDTVRVELEEVGVLENPVVAET
jgi:2-keto-4-pentenoate hydratase/2-oxohepta-3-ene-1,7-dioic acid hydratase in catechol pathway